MSDITDVTNAIGTILEKAPNLSTTDQTEVEMNVGTEEGSADFSSGGTGTNFVLRVKGKDATSSHEKDAT